MNRVEKLLADMTTHQRNAPATQGQVCEFIALVLRHMKVLSERIKELEKGERREP